VRLFRRNTDKQMTAEELLARLRSVSQAGDGRTFEDMCRANKALILASFAGWWAAAPSLKDDPIALDAYVQAVGLVAQVFSAKLGHPELMERMIGQEDKNPFVLAQRRMAEADAFMEQGRFDEAGALTGTVLEDLDQLEGTAVPDLAAKALGRLARSHFAVGRAEQALAPLEQALELCVTHDDRDGAAVYAMGLFEVHRYLGQSIEAAEHLRMVASIHEARRDHDTGWYRDEAAIVEAGEPLNRVVAIVGQRRCEVGNAGTALRTAASPDGLIQYEYQRNRPMLEQASRLTSQAAALASSARLPEALDGFDAASAVDPFAPDPIYNAGVVLLELGRFDEAAQRFERTEALAPGWFYCRRYAWLAGRLAARTLDPRIVPILIGLGDDDRWPAATVISELEPVIAALPDLGWLQLIQAKAYGRLGRRAETEDSLRAGLADETDEDVRSALLVDLAALVGTATPEGRRCQEEAVRLRGNLVAQASATIALGNARPGSSIDQPS
jgi:tetratricopeptide (TPR) repeat protein